MALSPLAIWEYAFLKQLGENAEKKFNLSTLVSSNIQKPVRDSQYGVLHPEKTDCWHLKDKTTNAEDL